MPPTSTRPDAPIVAAGPQPAHLTGLTVRERQVVVVALRGRRAPGIARDLDLTPSTVRSHLSNAYRKLGVRDHDELLTRYGSAHEQERLLAAALAGLGHAVVVADDAGAIVAWNAAAARRFGWTGDGPRGRPVTELLLADEGTPPVDTVSTDGQRWSGRLALRAANGTVERAVVAMAPVVLDDGTQLGRVWSVDLPTG